MMKRILTLALALMMAAGCATITGWAMAEGKYAEPVVVSMNLMNQERLGQPEDPRWQIVKEKFNLTFDYIPCNWGEWNDKIRTWIATDDAPDLIWWDVKGAQAQEYRSWAREGAFAPLDAKYFTEDRPNLKNVYDNSPSIPALSVDGVLYSWPSMRDNPPEAESCYTSHWCYRRDWAKAVGLYKEGDIYTWEEWIELLRAVIAQDPGGNGSGNAALVMASWAFPHAPALFVGPPAAEGNETSSYIKVDGQYVWPPALEEYKKGVKVTYDMYQEGLIYQDNLLFMGSEPEEMVRAGLAFAIYNVTGTLNNWTTDMLRDVIIKEREDFGIAIVYSRDGNWYMTQTEDYWTITAFSHRMEEDRVNRVLDFWEYMFTTEGYQMRNYGRVDVDYKVTGPGISDIEPLWPYDDAASDYVNPFLNKYEFNEATGANNGKTIVPPNTPAYMYNERTRLWNSFAASENKVVKVFDYDVAFGSAPQKDLNGSFGMRVKEKLIELLPQKGIDIEAEWDKYIESMMPEVQLVLDELNGGALN
jgi:ABC-type glycerol-3-phosphate transport system substrate-binding protein